jgi:hypothetical protein
MKNTICVLIIYVLEILNQCNWAKSAYGIKLKYKLNLLLAGIFSIVALAIFNIIAEKFLLFGQFPFLTFIFSFAFSVLLLDDKSQTLKLLSTALILKIASMLLWLVGVSLTLIRYDNFEYSLALLIIAIIISVTTYALIRLLKKRHVIFLSADYSKKELICFILGESALILILCVITEYSSHYSAVSEIEIPLIIISCAIMVFICYHMLSMKYENRAMKAEQEIAVKLIKAQENYYKALLKKEEQTRAFRHDYRNHLYCMKALSDNNEFVKLREYINELNKSQNEIHTLNTSGDKLVDVIINELMNNHPSVKLKLFGAFDDNQVVEQVDMCTIFSNLLANAFEEAEKSTDKTVRLHIKRLKANLFICIQNSVCKMPIIENNEIKTSKSGAGHGYGLKNVKMSLDKYNGLLELKCENNIFEANILIPNVIKDEHV